MPRSALVSVPGGSYSIVESPLFLSQGARTKKLYTLKCQDHVAFIYFIYLFINTAIPERDFSRWVTGYKKDVWFTAVVQCNTGEAAPSRLGYKKLIQISHTNKNNHRVFAIQC